METLTFLMPTSFYPPYHIGGDAVFVQYLGEELARRGHEVHVMTSVNAYRLKKKAGVVKDTQNSGVFIHDLRSPCGTLSPLSAFTFGSSHYYTCNFSKLLCQIKPDIVHHHNVMLLGYELLKKSGAYVSIHTTHDFWLVCPSYRLTTNREERCERKRCLLCTISNKRIPQFWRYSSSLRNKLQDLDLIISPCNFFKNILADETTARVVHIPNFVPNPPKSLQNNTVSDFFLCAGRLERSRGILTLLNVFSSKDIRSRLVFVGTGALASYVTNFIKSRGLQDKIRYLGWVSNDELHDLYEGALATIEATNHPANFPLVALESLSHGTPVIASNMGGLPEIVEKVGEKLIYNNVAELKEILTKFDKKKYPSHMVKDVYEKYYSPEAHLKQYFNEIKNIQMHSA